MRTTATPTADIAADTLWRCGGRDCGAGECAHEDEELHRHASGSGPKYAPSIVHDVLRSPGAPLADAVRQQMETRLGHSFADVSVHTDARAADSAAAVRAYAYTVGRQVVFGAGQYRPHTVGGQQLLAHELIHAASAGPHALTGGRLRVSTPDDAAERLATEHSRTAVVGSRPVSPPTPASLTHGGAAELHRAVYVCDEHRTLPSGTANPGPGITVSYHDKSVTTSAALEVSGPEADATKASTIQGNINRRWTGSFPDGYAISTTARVSARAAGAGAAGDSTDIELTKSGGRPSVTGRHWLVGSRYVSLNLDRPNATDYTVAHEFGHLLGLGDRYSEGIVSRIGGLLFGSQRTTTPDAGYENNIMGVSGGDLESANVRDLISRHASTECVRGHLESPL